MDFNHRAFFDLNVPNGLEDAIFVFCRDRHGLDRYTG
jgi:hypothetical protein